MEIGDVVVVTGTTPRENRMGVVEALQEAQFKGPRVRIAFLYGTSGVYPTYPESYDAPLTCWERFRNRRAIKKIRSQ